jgi:hypothetical protein
MYVDSISKGVGFHTGTAAGNSTPAWFVSVTGACVAIAAGTLTDDRGDGGGATA